MKVLGMFLCVFLIGCQSLTKKKFVKITGNEDCIEHLFEFASKMERTQDSLFLFRWEKNEEVYLNRIKNHSILSKKYPKLKVETMPLVYEFEYLYWLEIMGYNVDGIEECVKLLSKKNIEKIFGIPSEIRNYRSNYWKYDQKYYYRMLAIDRENDKVIKNPEYPCLLIFHFFDNKCTHFRLESLGCFVDN